MRDDIVAFCDDELVFIAQGIWRRPDESEKSFPPWRNVRAVLNVLRRPEALCCRVVAFVEESIEGFENDRLGLCGCCCWHPTRLGVWRCSPRTGLDRHRPGYPPP